MIDGFYSHVVVQLWLKCNYFYFPFRFIVNKVTVLPKKSYGVLFFLVVWMEMNLRTTQPSTGCGIPVGYLLRGDFYFEFVVMNFKKPIYTIIAFAKKAQEVLKIKFMRFL